MEIQTVKLKWFIFGLLCFALGSLSIIGYSMTPTNNNEHQGDIVYENSYFAFLLSITLMPIGFVIVVISAW